MFVWSMYFIFALTGRRRQQSVKVMVLVFGGGGEAGIGGGGDGGCQQGQLSATPPFLMYVGQSFVCKNFV